MKVIGEILMGAGLFIMLCGIAGLLKNPGFYRRLLLSSLIDTVGLLVLLAGVAVRQGLGSFLRQQKSRTNLPVVICIRQKSYGPRWSTFRSCFQSQLRV